MSTSNASKKQTPFQVKIGNYLIDRELGSGGFGIVYKGFDLAKNSAVAIKLEERENDSEKSPKLAQEYEIYHKLAGNKGICKVYDYLELEGYDAMVLEYKGPSLSQLFQMCGRKFSLCTVLHIMLQIVNRLELVHKAGYIYRDVKPGNFLLQTKRGKGKVYLIDFGLAKSYIGEDKYHVPYERQSFAGTAQFAPLNAHLSKAQSRRDDLESLGYMCIYFLKGELPWNSVRCKDKRERKKVIGNMKLATSVDNLCQDCPAEFKIYLDYVKGLEFTDTPDYNYIRKLFLNLMKKLGYDFDFQYDWLNKKFGKLELKTPKLKFVTNKNYVQAQNKP